METILTTEQVAEHLQVHWQTVLKYIKLKQLPAMKVGKGYRVSKHDLERFLEGRRTSAAVAMEME